MTGSHRRAVLCAMLLTTMLIGPARARTVAEVPDPRSSGAGHWISDPLGRISSPDRAAIDGLCERLLSETGKSLRVVLIERTDGRTPKEFATALFNAWRVGNADRNDGVLFITVLEARRSEVEVGDGIGEKLFPYKITRMIETVMPPRMRAGDVSGGVRAGVEGLDRLVRELGIASPPASSASQPPAPLTQPAKPAAPLEEPAAQAANPPDRPLPPKKSDGFQDGDGYILSFLLALFLAFLWGFWRVLRWMGRGIARLFTSPPPQCATCRVPMGKLSSGKAAAHLSDGQQLEEKLGAVTYSVFACPSCSKLEIQQHKAWICGFHACPGCGFVTATHDETVLTPATTYSSGEGRRHESCRRCSFRETSAYTIAMLVETSTSSSSDSSSSSSSDSSSSSSSSDSGGSSSGDSGGGGSW